MKREHAAAADAQPSSRKRETEDWKQAHKPSLSAGRTRAGRDTANHGGGGEM